MRRRGWVQPPPGRPFNFKLSFKDTASAGFAESHFLYFGRIGVKQNRWAPLQMKLADQLGLRTPRNRLVRLKLNGQNLGVYWQFEHWGRNTFAPYGISEADVYAESDDQRFPVNFYLWKNLDSWKKYDVDGATGAPEQEDFSELAALLDLVNDADDATFSRQIFDLLEFDAWVAWLIHTSAMNSYHQGGHINARLLLNRDTMRFEPLPWDVVPGVIKRVTPRGIYTTHPLIVRLMNNERFQLSFSRRLYAFYEQLEAEVDQLFHNLYRDPQLECSLLSSDHRDPDPNLKFPKSWSYAALETWAITPSWPETVNNMRGTFMAAVRSHKQYLEMSSMFISRDVSAKSEGGLVPIARLGYRSQVASILASIDLPLGSTDFDGQELDVELVIRPRPLARIRNSPVLPSNSEPEELRVQRRVTISGGRILLDKLELTLLPNYPRASPLYGKADYNRGWRPIESRDYDIYLRLSARVPLAATRLTVTARSAATNKPLDVFYKNFRNEQRLSTLSAARG